MEIAYVRGNHNLLKIKKNEKERNKEGLLVLYMEANTLFCTIEIVIFSLYGNIMCFDKR